MAENKKFAKEEIKEQLEKKLGKKFTDEELEKIAGGKSSYNDACNGITSLEIARCYAFKNITPDVFKDGYVNPWK